MMRKGSLAERPVDAVLRAAAADAFTGAVEISADVQGTVLLDGGVVVAAALDGVGVPATFGPTGEPSPEDLQASIRDVVATLSDAGDGRYECHELHPSIYRISVKHRTRYHVDALLADVASLSERRTLGSWSGTVLEAGRGTRRTEVTLDADMWRVLVAMTEPTTVHRLASRLAWDAERIADALRRLQDRRLIRGRRPEHESASSITDEIDQLWPSTSTAPQPRDPFDRPGDEVTDGASGVAATALATDDPVPSDIGIDVTEWFDAEADGEAGEEPAAVFEDAARALRTPAAPPWRSRRRP